LSAANLRGADLSSTKLQGASLERVILKGAVLKHAFLRGANLEGATLCGADLRSDLGESEAPECAIFTNLLYDAHTRWPVGFDPGWHGAIRG